MLFFFDEDNQEIGIDGDLVYSLQDEANSALKKGKSTSWWKIFFWMLVLILLIGGLFLFARKLGIDKRINSGINPNLVDNESIDDLSFVPGQNVH